jgi:hypothetical protein
MTEQSLTLAGSWASIISLFVSIWVLLYARSIRKNIVRFRRKQRVRNLIDEAFRLPDDAVPFSVPTKTKLASLKRNIPVPRFARFSARAHIIKEIHRCIDAEQISEMKEALNDFQSYSEEA